MQIPRGPEGLNCHRCLPKKVAMAKVCSQCSLWISVRGKDKNTGREIDDWMCADRAQILFLGEIAKNTLSNVAATESFRNESVNVGLANLNMATQQQGYASVETKNFIDQFPKKLIGSDVER